MPQRIIIVGSGFAGFWGALAARRLISSSIEEGNSAAADIEVVVIAPDARLVMRPRLYEPEPEKYSAAVDDVYLACGIKFVHGIVSQIHTEKKEVEMMDRAGARSTLSYDNLVLAAGSRVVHPKIPGLSEHAFSVDQYEDAVRLERHLQSLTSKPASKGRNTVVVCGAGFTGVEVATELPTRLRAIFGTDQDIRVVAVERASVVGPDLGATTRPFIHAAFEELGVEAKLNTSVTAIDAEGVTLSSGERIETLTAVWTAGVVGSHLAQQVSGEKDQMGRLQVGQDLRVPSTPSVFATGDAAHVAADELGHCAKMSCQHALPLGKFAGHNAAADLLNLPLLNYSQPIYNTCLDLGATGAVVGQGWELEILYSGSKAKKIKQFINQKLIYPPRPIPAEAFMAADPYFGVGGDDLSNHPNLNRFLKELEATA